MNGQRVENEHTVKESLTSSWNNELQSYLQQHLWELSWNLITCIFLSSKHIINSSFNISMKQILIPHFTDEKTKVLKN